MNDWSRAVSNRPDQALPDGMKTITGNRGLQIEEKLVFEQDSPGRCGVDLTDPDPFEVRLGGLEREGSIGLPGLSEPQWYAILPACRKRTTQSTAGFIRSALAR